MRRQLGIFAAMAAMLSMQSQQASAAASNTVQYQKGMAAALASKQLKVTPQSDDRNPYKYYRTPKKNQRQYRKWLAQNPNMRRGKKFR